MNQITLSTSYLHIEPNTYWSAIRVSHKLDEIGNNANIGIRGFTMWKQKNPVLKCYPKWG